MKKKNAMQRLNKIVNEKGPLIIEVTPDWKVIYEIWKADEKREAMPYGYIERKKFDEKIFSNVYKKYLKNLSDNVGIVKISGSFFEVCNLWNLFWDLASYAKEIGYFVIADLNASTASARYAETYLGKESPIDAITITPYLGTDGVKPFLDKAKVNGKGVLVVVKTPNPSAYEVQDALLSDYRPFCELVADMVNQWGEYTNPDADDYTLVGAVVGTKNTEQIVRLRHLMPKSIILVPEYESKDITVRDLMPNFDSKGCGAIISSDNLITAYEEYNGKYTKKDWLEAAKAKLHEKQAKLEAEICYYLEQTNED